MSRGNKDLKSNKTRIVSNKTIDASTPILLNQFYLIEQLEDVERTFNRLSGGMGVDKSIAFFEKVESLSEEARLVAKVIIKAPGEFVATSGNITRISVLKAMRKWHWPPHVRRKVILELQSLF